ncbi:MAG TPA: type II secretion system protein [Thermotogota bacterium]|nr:type II secretion system protein [Thermotogota bacterium]
MKMRRRSGDTLVEMMMAFVILIFVLGITVGGSAWVVTLEKKTVVKSDIYDVAYSYAEEILATEYGSLNSLADEVELNGFTYSRTATPNSMNNFLESGWTVNYVTLGVKLDDENNEFGDEEYYVKMTVIPKQ